MGGLWGVLSSGAAAAAFRSDLPPVAKRKLPGVPEWNRASEKEMPDALDTGSDLTGIGVQGRAAPGCEAEAASLWGEHKAIQRRGMLTGIHGGL